MQANARHGVLLGFAGFSLLSCGDAVAKSMAGEWSPMAVAALRFVIGAIALAALLRSKEGAAGFRPKSWRLQIARGTCLGISTLFFFSAIFVMPLADAAALTFLSPILIAILSGPLLGEKVSRAAWLATFLAFAGMAIILRPNIAQLGWAALLPLGAALFFALMVIANRASAGQGSALSMQAMLALIAAPVLLVGATLGLASGLDALAVGMPDWTVVARCALIALTASVSHWLIYLGTERAGASTIAPTTYIQLLVATVLGWMFFGDRPDLATLLGAALIIGAGLYLWRHGTHAIKARGN